ncbi:regulating synaptic membrane exocytosis protein 1-like isoform X2 [Gigantopelta aegis]|uniref:regulating synaptic membrane exocytosis protein 1-like isoform X2 n=1 Tax=Gigantopelta aegis TaxID=1735272 RepID=UPI001B88A074|nr:regulating synaptic membrane exocytosis protein 1-like isoform X2 [Gigantopelta aegis]
MAFLMKKSVSSKADDSKSQVACPAGPMCPPTPELTTLTPEELLILRDVFRRQEQFEREESERIRKISNDLQEFEQTVKEQSSHKSPHVDLRLCRLCYKTKFVDGIGRMCHDCHKRVCNKCGSFTKYRRDVRKNKSVRGKWRCNMCQMKREAVCKTGSWYHRTSPTENENDENNAMVKLKSSFSADYDSENSERESQLLTCDTETDALPSGNRTDPELYRSLDSPQGGTKIGPKKSRRRSLPVGPVLQSGEDDDDDDCVNNGDHLKRERMLFLQRRQLRKLKKRQYSTQTSEEDAGAPPSEGSDQEGVGSFELNSCSEDLSRPIITFDACSFGRDQDVIPTYFSTSKLSLESISDSSSVLSYATKESSLSDGTESPLLMRIKRQNAVYGSSSSSVFSDTKQSDSQGGANSPSAVRNANSPNHVRNTNSPKPVRNANSPQPVRNTNSPKPSRNANSPIHVRNANSPTPVRNANSPIPVRNANSHSSVRNGGSREAGSDERSKDSRHPDNKHEMFNRRITLSKCECINPSDKEQTKRLCSIKPHHPHEIILHRDRNDRSQKTNGLGMRIVGGMRVDAILGAYVVMVIKGGPADVQGHIEEGDQILQWNGQSLTNVTFEEARTIMDNSGEVVQLIVRHRHRKIETQDTSPEHRVIRLVSADMSCLGKGNIPYPLDNQSFPRPRRRMLPKTPIEIKKETRKITGQILIQMTHCPATDTLTVSLLKAKELSIPEKSYDVPSPFALIHMLPRRRLYVPSETKCVEKTHMPEWNHVCSFENISEEKLCKRSIEITVWNREEKEDFFMGEVLLDLGDVPLDEDYTWYQLEDHDDNSSPLPERKHSVPEVIPPKLENPNTLSSPSPSPSNSRRYSPKESRRSSPLEISRFSPNESRRSSPKDSRKSSPRDSRKSSIRDSKKSSPNVCSRSPKETRRSITPNSPERRLSIKGSPVMERNQPGVTPPVSPILAFGMELSSPQRSSFRSKMKRRMASAVSRVSSSLTVLDRRDSAEEPNHGELHRSRSFCEESGPDTNPLHHTRRTSANFDLLAPPRPLSRANSISSFYDSDDLSDQASWHTVSPVERPPPDGDDVTSTLGPAQVPPKPAAENLVCGEVRLGFIVSKGHLEIDVLRVRGFEKGECGLPPDAYVKTYLIEGSKVIQKKKTQVVKATGESCYRRKVKYSACNIHGRYMKINIWERCKGFEKKRCLGESVVKLDSLDLNQQTVGWYKLFPVNTTELGSDESLYHW